MQGRSGISAQREKMHGPQRGYLHRGKKCRAAVRKSAFRKTMQDRCGDTCTEEKMQGRSEDISIEKNSAGSESRYWQRGKTMHGSQYGYLQRSSGDNCREAVQIFYHSYILCAYRRIFLF